MIWYELSKNSLKDSTITKDASKYIAENHDYVIHIATLMANGLKSIDIEEVVQDVYISLYEQERCGGGFDTSKNITVEQFVFGRIRGYLRNEAYRGFDVKAGKKNFYPIHASVTEAFNVFYEHTPYVDNNLDRIVDSSTIEHDLITCILATQTAQISLSKLLTSPMDLFTSKTWGWVIKNNFNKEECEALRNVLEYPDRQGVINLLAEVLPSFAS